jgi:hypothetical protein
MTSRISSDLRRLVASRANHVCEYCLIHEEDTYLGCQVDHIISEKHAGLTVSENLAYACTFCNRAKGADIGSLDSSGSFTRFYHPRLDRWTDDFVLQEARIQPISSLGEATASILGLNSEQRIAEREALIHLGRYPSSEARLVMGVA